MKRVLLLPAARKGTAVRKFLVIAALCLCAAPAAAQEPAKTQTPAQPATQDATQKPAGERVDMATAEQAVSGRVGEFRDALRKGDEAALASIYADDYTITTESGEVRTRAQRLEWVKANTARLSTLEFQDLKVRVYGDAAVVTGHATNQGDAINSRIIQVWVKQGGTWRMVVGQTTAIGPAQPAEKKP